MELQVKQFKEDGYARFDGFFTQEYINQLNSILDSIDFKVGETVFDEDKTGKIKQVQYLWDYHDEFAKIVDKVRTIAAKLT